MPEDGNQQRVQRDWLGHAIQVAAIAAIILVPLFAYENSKQSELYTLKGNQQAMLAELHADENQITSISIHNVSVDQKLDSISQGIATLTAQLGDLRETLSTSHSSTAK